MYPKKEQHMFLTVNAFLTAIEFYNYYKMKMYNFIIVSD